MMNSNLGPCRLNIADPVKVSDRDGTGSHCAAV